MERNGQSNEQSLGMCSCGTPLSWSPERRAEEVGEGSLSQFPSTSVVIPAYNEEHALGAVVQEIATVLAKLGIEYEIIIVDDGSTDNTTKTAEELGVTVLRHSSNRGYGAAVKTGILAAKYDMICITDADGTYPAEEIPELLRRMQRSDMVVGARTGSSVAIPRLRRFPKWILNRLANYVTQSQIPDLNSGMRVFRKDSAVQYFHILPDQFSLTTTITMAMLCDKYAVTYLPINYRRRTGGKSKIVPWDAAAFTVLIVRMAMLFRPLRVFLPCALFCFSYAIFKLCWDLLIAADRNISTTAAVAMLGALQIALIGMLGEAIATRLWRLQPGPGTMLYQARHQRETRVVASQKSPLHTNPS